MADQGRFVGDPQPGGFDTAAESQGNAGNSELHEQFISSVPEELRDAATQLVPHWDKHVQSKFTEAANYRKQWEPYEPLGLSNYQPEDIQQALGLHQAINDPEQITGLYDQLGDYLRANGMLDDDGAGVEEFDGGEYDVDPQLMQTVQQLQQQVNQQHQFIQGWQEQQAQAQAQQFVDQQLDAIRSEHKNLTDEDIDTICTFALKYEGREAIQRGFADYQQLMSRAEKGIFEKKSEAPDPANSGGTAATKPEAITTYEDARKAAMERLRQGNQ